MRKTEMKNQRKEGINLRELDTDLLADIEEIQAGRYTICPTWEAVERLLDCFEDNDNWRIEQLSTGMFAILPDKHTTQQPRIFQELLDEDK